MEPDSWESEETSTFELVGIRFASVPKKQSGAKGSCTAATGLPHKKKQEESARERALCQLTECF